MSNTIPVSKEQTATTQEFLSQKQLPLHKQTAVTDILNVHLNMTAKQMADELEKYPLSVFNSRYIIQGVTIRNVNDEIIIDSEIGIILKFTGDVKVKDASAWTTKDNLPTELNKHDRYLISLAIHEMTLGK